MGDKVKTDRRDAMTLAQSLRAGQLTEVWVPDEAHEAMRDLVRMRALAMKDQRKARQQLHSFLLRHGRSFPGKHWTKAHRRWLGELTFAQPAQHLVLEELLARIERAEELCGRLKQAIVDLVPQWTLAPVVAAVQALRGVSILVAATVVAEVGNFSRFENPRQLMAYLGLNPSEHSSGATIKRGPITKTGNSLARTCLVEAAWTYRHPARVTQIIRERMKGLPEPIRAIAWKAQVRLAARYRKLTASRQIGAEGDRRGGSRAGRIHLGYRTARRTQGGVTGQRNPQQKRRHPSSQDIGAQSGRQDLERWGTLDSGFEAGIAFAVIADAIAHARSLDRGSPATNLGHAVTNPRIRAGSTVVHSSCRLPWASINSTAA